MISTKKNVLIRTFTLAIFVSILSSTLNAQIIQFRGPDRNGIFPDTSLLKEWPTNGPEVIFITEGLGIGFA